MKHIREQAKSSQMARLRKLSAQGSLKWAKHGEHAPRKYATGGAVDGGEIGGAPARPNLGKSLRTKGKGKKGGTNVNVIVMPKGDGPAMGGPGGQPPMLPPRPMPPMGPLPGAGPMSAPGPGGPPPPGMRKHGGRVGFKKGGRVGKWEGGKTYDDDKGPPNPGEVSNAESAKYLRKKAEDTDSLPAVMGKGLVTGAGVGTFLGNNFRRGPGGLRSSLAKAAGAGIAALGGMGVKDGVDKEIAAYRARKEAEKFEESDKGKRFGGRAKMKRAKGGKAAAKC